jgi:hypothetical protein
MKMNRRRFLQAVVDQGVAGLIQSGGFERFSEAYGMAAASLSEVEIVTFFQIGDGGIEISPLRARRCSRQDLVRKGPNSYSVHWPSSVSVTVLGFRFNKPS